MTRIIDKSVIELSDNLGETSDGCGGKEESVTIKVNAEYQAAIAEIQAENAHDPWTGADKKGETLLTPMDSKTIKSAILKRLPEAKHINLVGVDGIAGRMKIVVVCQLAHETAILIEDSANVYMRHNELMNIVDNMWVELKSRKRLRKTNKLPASFLRSNALIDLSRYTK